MHLVCESNKLDDYLGETSEIDFSHSLIQAKAKQLFLSLSTDIEKAHAAYKFVRDEIFHSFDIQSPRVTWKASEVLSEAEGIGYAKANLLAALLRAIGIPTGFCYQRVNVKPEADTYVLHALNAVYFRSIGRWVRLDARGNNENIHAEFSVTEEKLAYRICAERGEFDYHTIYIQPNEKTKRALARYYNAVDLCLHHLPVQL